MPEGFVDYCCELLSTAGATESKRMFGGHGIYADGVFIAIIVGDTLYLKADPITRPEFERAGCTQFEYEARGKSHSMGYWTVPERAMDSPALMAPWARLALDAALRAAKGKPRKRK